MPRWMLVSVLAFGALSLAVAQSSAALPTIVGGDIPVYPATAKAARIEGEVRLRVSTDGRVVIGVEVIDGQPMLAKAAQSYAETWKFKQHTPTIFSSVFKFELLDSCDPNNENVRVTLNLPSEVTIRSPRPSYTCDPNAGLDLTKPLRVFLIACEVDGTQIPCERFSIELIGPALRLTPEIVRDGAGNKSFVIPKQLRELKTFGVDVKTPRGTFAIRELHGSFLKGKWHVGIDHSPFQEDNRHMAQGRTCFGFIHFQWSEPERIVSASCEQR
jgi:hypothetical protein